jgi:hypothetical protein
MPRRTPSKTTTSNKFAKVPLWWAEQAAQATRTPKAMVWIWLLHLAWASRSHTFRLPNERLLDRGVSRFTKVRALRELEAAGLIQVAWERGKSPTVTLLFL